MPETDAKLRVLVVEDSLLTADQIWESLQHVSMPVEITMVRTQSDAIAAAKDFAPRIIVLDLKLQEGTGFAVLKELNAMGIDPRPAVVVLTNYALPNYRHYALLTGAQYFLDKTKDFEVLPSLVESIVKRGH